MDLSEYPIEVQKYLKELLKRKVINHDALSDKTLMNYLYTQKLDEDYIDVMSHLPSGRLFP